MRIMSKHTQLRAKIKTAPAMTAKVTSPQLPQVDMWNRKGKSRTRFPIGFHPKFIIELLVVRA